MNRSAEITSIDAVQTLAAALHRFQHDASNALADVSQQVNRAVDWIQHDQKDYWAHEARRRMERAAEAKLNLQRALTYRKIGDYTPACREEKQVLEKAKQRLRAAEEKVEAVRHWSRMVDQAVFKYKGGTTLLTQWLEAELPKALAALERMSVALEAYVAVEASPGDAAGTPQPSAGAEEASPEADSRRDEEAPGQPAEPPAEQGVAGGAAEEEPQR